jgi:hypothetical protein
MFVSERRAGKKAVVHRYWTSEEQAAVKQHFAKFFMTEKLPGKSDIQPVLEIETRLSRRSWRNIKDFVRNMKSKS